LPDLPILFAKAANVVGVHWFGGRLAILFVKITPSEITSAIFIAFDILFDFDTRMLKSGDVDSFFVLNLYFWQ